MARLEITYRVLMSTFLSRYAMSGPSRDNHEIERRRHMALGVLVHLWAYCVIQNDPSHCCDPLFVDDELGAGTFAMMVEKGTVFVEEGVARWTGPDEDPSWLRPKPAKVITYVVRRGAEGGPVKIGRTRDFGGRISSLQTGSAEPLHVLATIPRDIEKDLHAACAAHRTQGEWFDGSPTFLGALASAMEALR
jgi:Meiotically Up-regulated Gene 113 (MUG113) protein